MQGSCPLKISPTASIPYFHKPKTLEQIWEQRLISCSSLGTERHPFGEESCFFFVFVLFLFLKEACRLHGLALAGLNLATSNWYNVDLDPCRCRGHRREGCRRRRASGNLRWLMESLGLCELQEVHYSAPGKRKRKEKKGTKYHLGVPGMEYAEDRNPDHSKTQTLSLRPALYPWL